MPQNPFDVRIRSIGGSDLGFMLHKSRDGHRQWSVRDAQTISPRLLTEEQITQAQLPPQLALTFPQDNWQAGIGAIRFRAETKKFLADGQSISVINDGRIRLAREITAYTVDSAPSEYVPSGFAVSQEGMPNFFIGQHPYDSPATTSNQLARETPPIAATRVYRNGVTLGDTTYAPCWADDAGSGGSYVAADEPRNYLYKTGTAASWTSITTAAKTLDGCKYMAVANQLLWGGYWADVADSTLNVDGPVFDNATAFSSDSVDQSYTFSYSVGTGDNVLLVVGVSSRDPVNNAQPTGVTYGGVSMTQVAAASDTDGVDLAVSLWYLIAPASGANDIVITYAANITSIRVVGTSLFGVDQSTPIEAGTTAKATSTAPSVAVTTNARDWAIDILGFRHTDNATVGAGQIERAEVNLTSHSAAVSTEEATGGSTTMSWTITSASWIIGAVSVNPATIQTGDTRVYTTGTPSSQFVAGDVIRIESEVLLVTAVTDSPPSLTVVRAYRGSVVATHAADTDIYEITENPHQVRSCADGTDMANWSTVTNIGTSDAPITALVSVGSTLVIIKTDGIYTLEEDGTVTPRMPGLANIAHDDFGKGSWAWQDKVFIPLHGGGLWELDTRSWVVRDISFTATMPEQSQYHGRVVAGAGQPGRLFVLVVETANTRYHVLMSEDPEQTGLETYNWTQIASISYTTGTDEDHANMLAVGVTRGAGTDHRLLVGVESTGSSLLPWFIPISDLDSSDEYASADGEAYTVAFDAGFPNVPKRAERIEVNTANLGSGSTNHRIHVRYRVDGSSWVYVHTGTGTNTDDGSTLTASNATISFSAGVTFYRIEFRCTLDRRDTGNQTTPEFHDFTFTCQLRMSSIKTIPLSLYVANGMRLRNGMIENQAKTKRDQLRTWNGQAAEVVLTDIEEGTRNCLFLPGVMEETELLEGYHRFPEYQIDVILAEVG